jgi:osmotically-inducible protein OsmY
MFSRNREPSHNARKILLFGGIAALAMYFFDPRLGKTRRARLKDQIGGLIRRGTREAERKTQYARGRLEGARHAASPEKPPENDAVLTAKVKSEVLRRSNYPKGRIAVNAANGVVELRGVCDTPEQISDLEQEVRKVTGVIDVHNYLHLPNTGAPNN